MDGKKKRKHRGKRRRGSRSIAAGNVLSILSGMFLLFIAFIPAMMMIVVFWYFAHTDFTAPLPVMPTSKTATAQ